jgi:hypothetical protein
MNGKTLGVSNEFKSGNPADMSSVQQRETIEGSSQ